MGFVHWGRNAQFENVCETGTHLPISETYAKGLHHKWDRQTLPNTLGIWEIIYLKTFKKNKKNISFSAGVNKDRKKKIS